jgi:hypothetical protein
MKTLFILIILVSVCAAQDTRPKLELEPTFNLNGGGFQAVSTSISGGTGMETEHFIWHVSGTYRAARKTNDGDQPNPHGNSRSLGLSLFGRTTGSWLFGVEGSYDELRTTNYKKTGQSISTGIGKDWNVRGYTFRLIGSYVLPVKCYYLQGGAHCSLPTIDVEQGINVHMTIPSPVQSGHAFFGKYMFFDERTYAGWIKTSEHGSYTHDASTSMGMLFRF